MVTDNSACKVTAVSAPRGLEAHVVLRDPAAATPELATGLQDLVKQQLAAHAYPRHLVFTGQLPKTPSGKIRRLVLRQQRRDESVRVSG